MSALMTGEILHPARRSGSATLAWRDDQPVFMLLVLVYAAVTAFGAFGLWRILRRRAE